MEANTITLAILAVVLVVLVVFILIRNHRDKEDLIHRINSDEDSQS